MCRLPSVGGISLPRERPGLGCAHRGSRLCRLQLEAQPAIIFTHATVFIGGALQRRAAVRAARRSRADLVRRWVTDGVAIRQGPAQGLLYLRRRSNRMGDTQAADASMASAMAASMYQPTHASPNGRAN